MVDIAGLDCQGNIKKGKEQTILENHKAPEDDFSNREVYSEGDTTTSDSDSEYRT